MRARPHACGSSHEHLRSVHGWTKEEVEKEKLKRKNNKYDGKDEYICAECDGTFFSKRVLQLHRQVKKNETMDTVDVTLKITFVKIFQMKHGEGVAIHIICPICRKRFTSTAALAKHCNDSHASQAPGQDFSIIEGRFSSKDDFKVRGVV